LARWRTDAHIAATAATTLVEALSESITLFDSALDSYSTADAVILQEAIDEDFIAHEDLLDGLGDFVDAEAQDSILLQDALTVFIIPGNSSTPNPDPGNEPEPGEETPQGDWTEVPDQIDTEWIEVPQ